MTKAQMMIANTNDREIQEYLDTTFSPSLFSARSRGKNERLLDDEKKILYDIVRKGLKLNKGKNGKSEKKEFEKYWSLKLKEISEIMCRLQNEYGGKKRQLFNEDGTPKKTKEGQNMFIPLNPPAIPLLIKQVLFFGAFEFNAYFNAKEWIKVLQAEEVAISHNFFSREKKAVEYGRYYKYKQPANPLSYMGQKNGEVGVALKNLVYQAGDHDCFVDIFGGSGSASVAFPRKKNVKYVYNEWNEYVANYIEVIRDEELFPIFKERLLQVQKGIKKGLGEDELRNLSRDIKKLIRLRKTNVTSILRVITPDILNEFEKIYKDKSTQQYRALGYFAHFFRMKYMTFSKKVYGYILCKRRIPPDEFLNKPTVIGVVPNDILKKLRKIKAGKESAERRGLKIEMAVAEVMGHVFYFSRYMDVFDPRSVTKFNKWKGNNLDKFLEADLNDILGGFHKEISRLSEVRNGDFRNVIRRYGGENTLFYSDSPYVATTDYKTGNVGAFTPEMMDALIKGLGKANKKFIFSCRATASSFARRGKGKNLSQNQMNKDFEIAVAVLYPILEKCLEYQTGELYVLVLEQAGNTLETLLEKNGVIEIMIVNYKISSFSDKTYNYHYTAYPYSVFSEIWMKAKEGGKVSNLPRLYKHYPYFGKLGESEEV